ncbi:hypothetical protein KF728_21495 [Candidatus Obscuribacterales bacterium]|nr:hypothetical protein [Candidatus Obscuribacterales bacterium]
MSTKMKRQRFLRTNARQLGAAPLASLSDSAIWEVAVSPMVKGFLGSRGEGFSKVFETTEGLFPGDSLSNLNGWSVNGDETAIRNPVVGHYYRTANGAFIVKRDHVKIKAFAWFGDVLGGKPGELIFSWALRDRRFDGTKRANDTALLDFPYDEWHNAPLLMNGKQLDATSAETSLYSYLPGTGIAKACGDQEFEDFVASPYRYVDKPDVFLRLFEIAWRSERYPGQVSVPIPDVGKLAHASWDKLATRCGYDFLETAPSHLHVYGWNCAKGYACNNKEQQAVIADFQARAAKLKATGFKLSRLQESWLFVIQSLPAECIPAPLHLGSGKWMQNNIDQNNLWLYKPLSEKAKQLIAQTN